MPKRPPTAFLLFMTNFRPSYKQDNPSVTEVAKAGGSKWRGMTDEAFEQMAAAEKAKYEEAMAAYNSARNEDENEVCTTTEASEKEASEEAKENKNASAREVVAEETTEET